jgi:hypothetical protein
MAGRTLHDLEETAVALYAVASGRLPEDGASPLRESHAAKLCPYCREGRRCPRAEAAAWLARLGEAAPGA